MRDPILFGIPALLGFLITVRMIIKVWTNKKILLSDHAVKSQIMIINRDLFTIGWLVLIEAIYVVISVLVLVIPAPRPAWVGQFTVIVLISGSWIIALVAFHLDRSRDRLEAQVLTEIEEAKMDTGEQEIINK